MSSDKTVLVTGATGNQGGATARHLLRRGWRVRALVRDANAQGARALAALGAELIVGDMSDPASLRRAVDSVYGVFSVQPTERPGAGLTLADETQLGCNVGDAAKGAGVEHLVYTSVGGADRSTIEYTSSKRAIERHISDLGLPATILRPVSFMEGLSSPFGGITGETFVSPIKPEVKWQLIAVDDVGAFAAIAFGDPHTYIGKQLEIAGDQLTPPQIAATVGQPEDALCRMSRFRLRRSPHFPPSMLRR